MTKKKKHQNPNHAAFKECYDELSDEGKKEANAEVRDTHMILNEHSRRYHQIKVADRRNEIEDLEYRGIIIPGSMKIERKKVQAIGKKGAEEILFQLIRKGFI